MPILVLLFALIALIYGAVRAFDALAVRYGNDVAMGVAAVVLAVIAVLIAAFVRRRREVAANLRDGDWTHGLAGDWGEVRLAAGKTGDARAARRMLAIALVLEGVDRKSAAESCGMDRQTLR